MWSLQPRDLGVSNLASLPTIVGGDLGERIMPWGFMMSVHTSNDATTGPTHLPYPHPLLAQASTCSTYACSILLLHIWLSRERVCRQVMSSGCADKSLSIYVIHPFFNWLGRNRLYYLFTLTCGIQSGIHEHRLPPGSQLQPFPSFLTKSRESLKYKKKGLKVLSYRIKGKLKI